MKYFFISSCLLLFSSCATLIGGTKYYAHVNVEKHPNASITYKGIKRGYGYATFKVPRGEANKFTIIVQEENCEKQTFTFTKRKLRGWAMVGTILTWTGFYSGIPIPFGLAVDFATGAIWRPDTKEKGVLKIDNKHYSYTIADYSDCKPQDTNTQNKTDNPKSKADRLFELKVLLERGVLTKEEFEKEKKKILDEP